MPETVNVDTIKLVDCIENYQRKGKAVILNDGKVVGFVKESEDKK